MTDLIYHVLSNDSGVTAITGNRITVDMRTQRAGTPAITIDWVATDDEYALGGNVCTNEYTYEVIGYSTDMATAHNLLKAMRSALNTLNGTYNTGANTYTVVASEIVDRHVETIIDLDVIESSLTLIVTTNDTAS